MSTLEDSKSIAANEEVLVPAAGALLYRAHHNKTNHNAKPRIPRPCTYCAETHRPEKCDKIKTVEKACLNMIELNTILTEVEAVFDSRPLTYLYIDINDASPLAPSHFLCGHRLLTLLLISRELPYE